MDKKKVTLPEFWVKKYKSENLLDKLTDAILWSSFPEPTSMDGRRLLKDNETLLMFADKQKEDFALEPYGDNVIEFIPNSVRQQGIGLSAYEQRGMLSIDMYFFPCDYTEDTSRYLPMWAIRLPIYASDNEELIQGFADKYILTGPKSLIKDYEHCCVIPFSIDKVAILEGNFIDHYTKTKRICESVVKDGNAFERDSCKRFLEFIKTVGKR